MTAKLCLSLFTEPQNNKMSRTTYAAYPSRLKSKTQELLCSRVQANKTEVIVEIAKATGLSKTWLHMLSNNQLKSPDVTKIERLYNYLSPIPLKV